MDLFSNPLRNQLHHLHHFWQKTGCKHPHFCNNMPLLPNNMPLLPNNMPLLSNKVFHVDDAGQGLLFI